EVHDGIDHGAGVGIWILDDVADSVGRPIEERDDFRFDGQVGREWYWSGGHGNLLPVRRSGPYATASNGRPERIGSEDAANHGSHEDERTGFARAECRDGAAWAKAGYAPADAEQC